MSLTRREFLLKTSTTGLGFILPSFYERALAYYENYGEPLIEAKKGAGTTLYVNQDLDLELCLGDPSDRPPEMTQGELIEKYWYGGLKQFYEDMPYFETYQHYDLDAKAHFDDVLDCWGLVDSPWAKAYKYLGELDLGPNLTSPEAVGGIATFTGAPGSNYLAYGANDYLSISLLQDRLNQLNTGIRIELV